MIKTIFFDFDGVLTTDGKGSGITCKNIQNEIPHVSYETILHCYRVHHHEVLKGEVRHSEMWEEFCKCVGTPLDISVLHNSFKNTPKNASMFALVQKLHNKYKLGIITDNGSERMAILIKEMKLDEFFDTIIISSNVGATKQEPKIFQEALEIVQCHADECVFIDNDQKNLVMPKQLGFYTFWHDHDKNDLMLLAKQLKTWGVSII